MTSENEEHRLTKGMSDLKASLGNIMMSESIQMDNPFSISDIRMTQSETPVTAAASAAVSAAAATAAAPAAALAPAAAAGTTDVGVDVGSGNIFVARVTDVAVADPYLALQPSKKKLSSLESQRVMNVYVDMVEKTGLVSMFPFVLANLHLFEDVFDDNLKTRFKIHTEIQASYTEIRRDFLTFRRRMRQTSYNVSKDLTEEDNYRKQQLMREVSFPGDDGETKNKTYIHDEESSLFDTSDEVELIYKHSSSDDDVYYAETFNDDIDDGAKHVGGKMYCDEQQKEFPSSEGEQNNGFCLQSTSSSDSHYSVDSSVEMRESSDESVKARELGKHLMVVGQRLSNSCKNILRAIGANPRAANEIAKYTYNMSPELTEFVSKLNELKSILRIRLLTTPLEEKEQQEYLKETAEKAVTNQKLIEKLEKELAEVTAMKDEQVKLKTDKIRKLQNDIQQIDKSSIENIRRVKAEADNIIATEMKGSESKTQTVYQELVQSKVTFNNRTTAHREQEQDLRRRKFKAETEVENWIQKYDQDMGQLQEEFETIEKIYSEEKKQLIELEERFSSLETEYLRIRSEREDARMWKAEYERKMVMMVRAATTVQAFWRSYKVRKMLKSKKKKVAAASGKRKKKK